MYQVDGLDLQRLDEAFGLGIVVGVSKPAHRADEPMLSEQLAASLAGILRTSIRVKDTAPWRLPGSNSGLQCFNCQTCVDRRISDPPGATRRRECYRGAFLTPPSGGSEQRGSANEERAI